MRRMQLHRNNKYIEYLLLYYKNNFQSIPESSCKYLQKYAKILSILRQTIIQSKISQFKALYLQEKCHQLCKFNENVFN